MLMYEVLTGLVVACPNNSREVGVIIIENRSDSGFETSDWEQRLALHAELLPRRFRRRNLPDFIEHTRPR